SHPPAGPATAAALAARRRSASGAPRSNGLRRRPMSRPAHGALLSVCLGLGALACRAEASAARPRATAEPPSTAPAEVPVATSPEPPAALVPSVAPEALTNAAPRRTGHETALGETRFVIW